MTLAAVVFDLDGTLIDSRPDLATAVNRMRADLRLPPLALETVGSMVGEGSKSLVQRALACGGAHPDADLCERAHGRFLEHYAAVCTAETRPYDGVAGLLAAAAHGRQLALLTNKPIAMTRTLIDHFDWTRLFRVVIGGDSLPYRKPDGRGLSRIAAELAVAPADVMLVGDSRIDAETARAAGTRFFWAEWGYAAPGDRRELAGGDSARSPAALAGWFEASAQ